MKMKIKGIFVCLIMVFTVVIPVTAITDMHDIREISYDVDVPIWDIGDEWTYNFIESVVDYDLVTYSLSGDLNFKVVDNSGDSYILEAVSRPSGVFDLGNFGLKTTILTKLSMRLQIRKADLGLESFREILKGFFLVTFGSVTLPIPLQVTGNVNVEFDPSWIIIPFPLYDGKSGNLSGTEFVYTDYYMKLFWGLIPVLGPMNISWPITSVPYTCSEEEISVEAGTFNVFNVSAIWLDDSKFVSYYADEIGNIAKEVIYIPCAGGGVRYSLLLELKDWSYTP